MHAEQHRSRTTSERLAATPSRERPAPPHGLLALQRSIGNTAVSRLLSLQRMPDASATDDKKWISQPAYASGDQFAIAAALMANPTWQVLVEYRTSAEQQAGEKSAKFYRTSGIRDTNIHLLDKSTSNEERARLTGMSSTSQLRKKKLALGQVTSHVGNTFNDDMRGTVREGWGLERETGEANSEDAKVESWLAGKGVELSESSKVAVLWSRFSGKNKEVHIEHDTGYIGMAQIIAGLGSLDYVLIVGDAAPKEKTSGVESPEEAQEIKHRKYASIASHYNGNDNESNASFSAKVVDLTEFWEDKKVEAWGGDSRTGQFLLFDRLNRLASPARHLGFRSGNLEAMALMGFKVRYLEEPGSIGGGRMEAWHDAQTDGKGIGYERITVDSPPTRSGKYQVDTFDQDRRARGDQKHAEWHHDKTGREPKRWVEEPDSAEERRARHKGFSEGDLAKIDDWLLHGADPA